MPSGPVPPGAVFPSPQSHVTLKEVDGTAVPPYVPEMLQSVGVVDVPTTHVIEAASAGGAGGGGGGVTGAARTVTSAELEAVRPSASVAVTAAVKVPAPAYVCAIPPPVAVPVVLSPKFHAVDAID